MRRESNDSDFQESLIDYFVIIGEQHVHPKDNDIYKPTILSTITSKYAKIPLINESFLLHLIYPNELHLKDLKPLSQNTTQYQKLLFAINISFGLYLQPSLDSNSIASKSVILSNNFESKYEIGRSIIIFLSLLCSIFKLIEFISDSILEVDS